jgi:hypothetical protein
LSLAVVQGFFVHGLFKKLAEQNEWMPYFESEKKK